MRTLGCDHSTLGSFIRGTLLVATTAKVGIFSYLELTIWTANKYNVIAALVMYQRARRFASLSTSISPADLAQFLFLAEQQLDAYLVTINALTLVDSKVGAYIVLPVSVDEPSHLSGLVSQARKRRKLTKHIPEDKFGGGKRDSEFIGLQDVREEYALLSAKVELIRRDPALLGHSGKPALATWYIQTTN